MPAFLRQLVFLAGTLFFVSACSLETESDPVEEKLQGLGGALGACTDVADCTQTGLECQIVRCVAGSCRRDDEFLDGNSCSDDGEVCTDNVCDAGACIAVNNNASCDDGDACTENDTCNGGSCDSGTALDCDDDNVCTTDSCNVSTGCVNAFLPAGENCSDDSVCTDGDTCNGAGVCVPGPALDCDDGIVCTADSCDPVGGCSNDSLAVNTPCDDGDACTVGTVCDGGTSCGGGGPLDCDDGEFCTTDSCDSGSGCINTARTGVSCDDGNACTLADVCTASGNCVGPTPRNCDDDETCTADSCNPATGCVNDGTPRNGAACTDDDECTVMDTCNAGSCTPSGPRICDDGKVCTTNSCDSETGCIFTARTGETCSDGLTCTEGDLCNSEGDCAPGPANDDLCPDAECALGECRLGEGCRLNARLKLGDPCRPAVGVCDIQEDCDGTSTTCGVDVLVAADTLECGAPSCTSGVSTEATMCSGSSGLCPAQTPMDCGGFACDASSPPDCFSTCTTDVQCLSTHFCDAGVCMLRTGAGEPCDTSAECNQGDECVDGVCCNNSCTGQCESCNQAGSEGVCSPVSGAPQNGRPACATDGSSCGGSCDGVLRSACVFPATGTVCEAASCDPASNTAVEDSLCNGAGSCVRPTPSSCAPFVCDTVSCHGDCTLDSECEAGLQCNAGVCVDLFVNGEACTLGSQCASGLCVDDVCCDGSCTGQCEACNVAGLLGECSPVQGAPVGNRAQCLGTDSCAGSCDGSQRTACTFPGTDTVCAAAACVEGTANETAFCSGSGSCSLAVAVSCPDGCDGTLCAGGECRTDAECTEVGEICQAGICTPAGGGGDSCSDDADCSSGFCVDNVCCDSACDGQCEACDVAGSEGSCQAVPAGEAPHGNRQACSSDGSVCGGSCDGVQTNTCGYPTDTICRDASCAAGVAVVEASCDGSGVCPAEQEQDCGLVGCEAAALVCDGGCATDPTACATGEYCSAGICVTEKPNGETCGSAAQCTSGNCVDGYCCDSACTDQCAACNVRRAEGTCTASQGAPQGGRAACLGTGTCGAVCDGTTTTSCSFPDAQTSCGELKCDGGIITDAPSCNGEGRCAVGTVSTCPSLLCNGAECAEACVEDADCPGEEICQDGGCITDPLIHADDKGSCGCRIPGRRSPRGTGEPLLLLAPLLLMAWRRRRAGSDSVR